MPEVGGVGGGAKGQPINNAADATRQANASPQVTPIGSTPVGQPGLLGQPTGMPAPLAPGQTPPPALPDVLAGRDATQIIAAERMRSGGGVSATEQLLGLNQQPSVMGAFAAPPGNSEALRHMTPTMRRTIMRGLLEKQRERMRRLALLTRDEREGEGQRENGGRGRFAEELLEDSALPDQAQVARARQELGCAARMLDLLDELLVLQDYTISQMGTFSQG